MAGGDDLYAQERNQCGRYEDAIATWNGQGVRAHRLSRSGVPVYVLNSEAGQQIIDFSSQIAGAHRPFFS